MSETDFLIRIVRIHPETDSVITLMLERLDGQHFSFRNGQFITLLHDLSNKTIRRSYSISSYSDSHRNIGITIKRIPNGIISRWIFDRAKPGTIMSVMPPAGQFVVSEEERQEVDVLYFFCAGIGITPVMAMMQNMLESAVSRTHIVLVYSNHSRTDTVFLNKLELLHYTFPNRLDIHWFFSDTPRLEQARLNKLLIPNIVRRYGGSEAKARYFICGPQEYMRMVTYGLEEMGIQKSLIRKEIFDTTAPVMRHEPPDKSRHQVRIQGMRGEATFTVQYPESILQAAKRNGINLPFSCETGKCGACALVCLSGKVWMNYNEVLTERDLQAGRILTCTGFPVEGDVVLTLVG